MANVCPGYLRRNTTGMTIAAIIGSSRTTACRAPKLAAAAGTTPGGWSWVADALPLTVATPSNASQNAGTPSTSLGWRLSQAYTADTPQAYARRRGSSSYPKLTGRPRECGGQDSRPWPGVTPLWRKNLGSCPAAPGSPAAPGAAALTSAGHC